jgi:hypothetical protein
MEVNDQSQDPVALPLRKSFWYRLDRKLDGPQKRSGRYREEKRLLLLSRLESRLLSRHSRSLTSVPPELCRLLLTCGICPRFPCCSWIDLFPHLQHGGTTQSKNNTEKVESVHVHKRYRGPMITHLPWSGIPIHGLKLKALHDSLVTWCLSPAYNKCLSLSARS